MVCAIRSALARAAIRRGSSTMIFPPFSHGASASASGTRVVLPAPGGATSTAELLPASVRARSSSTASMGRGVAKLRGKCCSRTVLPLSPCGRGCLSEAKAGEGSLSTDADPSSGTDFVRAAFSHKGRREESASLPRLGPAADAFVDKAERRHVFGAIDIAQIDNDGLRHLALQAFQI